MSATKQVPQLDVQPREQLGSRYAARLRKTGQLPAVIYGHKKGSVHVSMAYKEIYTYLHENTHLLEAKLEDKSEPVLIREVQWDHLGTTLVHIDLERVDLTERVTVEVNVTLTGDAVGLKEEGAILEQQVTLLEIEALVTEIPEEIIVDVSGLNAGESISVAELKLPANVTTTADPETIIASVSVVEEQPEIEEDADAPTEPKVIGKEDEEESEEDADSNTKKK